MDAKRLRLEDSKTARPTKKRTDMGTVLNAPGNSQEVLKAERTGGTQGILTPMKSGKNTELKNAVMKARADEIEGYDQNGCDWIPPPQNPMTIIIFEIGSGQRYGFTRTKTDASEIRKSEA